MYYGCPCFIDVGRTAKQIFDLFFVDEMLFNKLNILLFLKIKNIFQKLFLFTFYDNEVLNLNE